MEAVGLWWSSSTQSCNAVVCITRHAPLEKTKVHSYAVSSWPAPFQGVVACRTDHLSSGHTWVGIRSICPLFDPSKLVHSIYVFLTRNPQQRFLAQLLEGQGRITEEQVPGTEHSQSLIHQLPPPGICYVLNSKNLFQKQKTHSGIHAKMASLWNRTGRIPCSDRAALQRCSATRAVRSSWERRWGAAWDGMRWKRQIHTWRKTLSEKGSAPAWH